MTDRKAFGVPAIEPEFLGKTAEKSDHFSNSLLDSDTSSNASSRIAACRETEHESLEAMLWPHSASASATSIEAAAGSQLCDPEIAAASGFWMDVGGPAEASPQESGSNVLPKLGDGFKEVREHSSSNKDDIDSMLLPWDM